MISTIQYCQNLYLSLNIPIYIYDLKGKLLTCYPKQDYSIVPPETYLSELMKSNNQVSYIETSIYSYYGCILDQKNKQRIILGPVYSIPYTKEPLSVMHKEYMIESYKTQLLDEFLIRVPQFNIDEFINVLILVNSIINQYQIEKGDINCVSDNYHSRCIDTNYYNSDILFDEMNLKNTYEFERMFFGAIENGNKEKIIQFLNNSKDCTYLDTSNSQSFNLREKKI